MKPLVYSQREVQTSFPFYGKEVWVVKLTQLYVLILYNTILAWITQYESGLAELLVLASFMLPHVCLKLKLRVIVTRSFWFDWCKECDLQPC